MCVCTASELCSSNYLPVCLTCINAISDDDCQQKGYYVLCSAFEVSATAQCTESESGLFSLSLSTDEFFRPCYKILSDFDAL